MRYAGIGVGDRVGTFMWTGSRHLEAYYATAGMGAVPHTVCGIVPMFHAMGWGIPWSALMLGCKVMPHRFMDPARLLRLIADEGVTLSAGVPTIWQGVKSVLETDPDAYDLSWLSSAPGMSTWGWMTSSPTARPGSQGGSCPTTYCSATPSRSPPRARLDKKAVRARLEAEGYRLPELR